jgi:predicted TIM-barrel fold metal-dependent hydrolase
VADTPERVNAANRFAASLDPDHFIGFGSIHAGLSAEENLESLRTNHLMGAKVHPLFPGYSLDDRRLWAILDAMQREFAVIVHVGEGDSPESNARCTPAMMRDLVRNSPALTSWHVISVGTGCWIRRRKCWLACRCPWTRRGHQPWPRLTLGASSGCSTGHDMVQPPGPNDCTTRHRISVIID